MRTYRDQRAWQDLQALLPPGYRLSPDAIEEDSWMWRGHRVHLDRFRRPRAAAKVVLHHGVGTNARQMSLILGAPLAARGYETVALDNLGYGLTDVTNGSSPTYDDWVELVLDFLAYERSRDDRPIVLYGLSAGGMLAYHVAARSAPAELAGIVGMTFLDQQSQAVRNETSVNPIVGRAAGMIGLFDHGRLSRFRVPMRAVAKMRALANSPEAMRILLADHTSAGNSVSVAFLNSYLNYTSAIEPEDFATCPILLTQPAEDRWSPLALSTPLLNRIQRVATEIVLLDNAGHLPLEQPGLDQMLNAVAAFTDAVSQRR